MSPSFIRFLQLLAIILAFVIPVYGLAKQIDSDEFIKTLPGVLLTGIIALVQLMHRKPTELKE